ncbi:high mobility group box domain-containing protein, partial [Blyttiomyces helicus]
MANRRDRPKAHAPRPSNSFILYRREQHVIITTQYKGIKAMNNNIISKIVAHMWKLEDPSVKAKYAAKAEEEKRVHQMKYPDYKYCPRKTAAK